MIVALLQTTPVAASPIEIAIGALLGLALSTGFLLSLFIGFLVVVGFTKFRRKHDSLVVRDLSDRIDGKFDFLPPDAPRGPADQLQTPELLEQAKN